MDNDILELIDQIETIVNTAPKVPMTHKVMVDAGEVLDICERLRQTIPRDVTRARRVLEEYEHRLAQASSGPAGLVGGAVDQVSTSKVGQVAAADSRGLTDQRRREAVGETDQRTQQILVAAEQQAKETIAQAEREAAACRADADAYAAEQLRRLERQMTTILASVRKGLEALKQ